MEQRLPLKHLPDLTLKPMALPYFCIPNFYAPYAPSLLDEVPKVSHHLLALLNAGAFRCSSLLRDIAMHNPCIGAIIQSLVKTHKNNPEDEAPQDCSAKHGCDDSIAVPVSVGRHVPDIRSSNVSDCVVQS